MKRIGLLSIFLFGLSVITPISNSFAQDSAVRVDVFSPQGTVKGVRQVSARFSAQMVPFGDQSLPEPFEISCPEKGRGRWADGKNWVYDFDRDLPAGVVCEFRLKPELKDLAGGPITGQRDFSFSTGGPAIKMSFPYDGSGNIDEAQAFVLVLDSEADEGSVLAGVSCSVEGINERIGVRVLHGEERMKILKNGPGYRYKDMPTFVIQCSRIFPQNAKVGLVWGKGVSSPSGVKTTEDQMLSFVVRRSFTANFSCERENAKADCIPMLPMRINFSSPVLWRSAREIVLRGHGKVYKPERAVSGDEGGEGEGTVAAAADDNFIDSITFRGPFPEKASFTIDVPKDLKDDAGRDLSNKVMFPLAVRTDFYPPLAKFSSRFGIIELKGDAALPVTLRNLEQEVRTRKLKVNGPEGTGNKLKEGLFDKAVKLGESVKPILPDSMKKKSDEYVEGLTGRLRKIRMDREERVIEWLRRVASAERENTVFREKGDVKEFSVPKPGGSKAFEVVGIPLKEPGFYVVEMESRILGESLLAGKKPMYVPTSALVTNLSAHFKWGRESSLVWVTTLDKADPVKDSLVSVRDCRGKVIWHGKTNEQGIAEIKSRLPKASDLPQCNSHINFGEVSRDLRGIDGGLFVFARAGDDMTFVHSSWDEGIEPWRYNLPYADYRGPLLAHTIFDRSLLRAGDTLHMKHVLRKHTTSGFSFPKGPDLPGSVIIFHQGSDQRYQFPLKWDAKGVAETTWQIPKDSRLGNYSVSLSRKTTAKKGARASTDGHEEGDEESFLGEGWTSGSFRVEEFRVPLMKGIIQPPKAPLVNVKEFDVDLAVAYLSGGGAGNAPVKLRSRVQPRYLRFEEYEDFSFANGQVKEETIRRSNYERADEQEVSNTQEKVRSRELKLDGAGGIRTEISGIPPVLLPSEVLAELEFRDPSGEVQTVSAKIPIWPSRLLVGIKPDSWASSKESFRFQVAVLDLAGKPVSAREVKVELFQRKYSSHRKRLLGGFYSYEHVSETKRVGSICEGKTDTRGLLLCDVKSPVYGNVILQASASDDEMNKSVANREVWIAGKGEWWFDVSDHDRIDLLPEKKRYEPGESARLQVRMPFRKAAALVTVEREGIIETFVKKLSGKNPVIEIPIKNHYAPNVFVSALVVRGRVSGVQPSALVDLGKPAFKLGIAEINVGWKGHELKVDVSPEKNVYKVREKARVNIKVRRANGGFPPKGSEVALAVVDEGLLELMPNSSWEILKAMMGRRGYEITTATAQMQVVGKRHYGLKALPHGGGGGRQVTREMFDTLLLWKGRVPLNNKGEASAEIPLNDSLTSFRVVAVATGGAGMFGTGQAGIKTTQDIMIHSGIPLLVREGDLFKAGFTIRNATGRKMDLEVGARIEGTEERAHAPVSETLMPGESKEIGWDVKVPYGIETISYEVEANEKGGEARDVLKVRQSVREAVPVRVIQATIAQLDNSVVFNVEKPKDAVSGKGGVNASFRPNLSQGLGGVVWYMKHYPYTCMEQKTSRAVALRDDGLWKAVLAELPAHLDRDGLVKYFPSMDSGSDVLTSYMLSISHEAGWTIPGYLKDRMEEGLKGFIEGRVVRYSFLQTADLSIRKISAIEALSRSGKAETKMLDSVSIEPNLWPTSAVLDWLNLLTRINDIPRRVDRMKEAGQILRSRMNFQGTTMGFSTERTDGLWWLMISTDTNAVRSVLTLLDLDGWREDMPRLVRGALGRQQRGAWALTTANAWGVLAMEKFAKKFEAVPVSGTTTAALDDKTKAVDWGKTPEGKNLTFPWPRGKESLNVSHNGGGKPWLTVQGLAAVPLKEPLSSGYKIKKIITPAEQKAGAGWSRGDVVRVRLELDAQADMTWVVVNDPVPAGSAILGTGLGRDSQILARGEKSEGWVFPAFTERSFEAYRAYYEFVPKGKWTVEYTLRLNNGGTFHLPPTRVEALYAPEMFGEIPNKKWEIGE